MALSIVQSRRQLSALIAAAQPQPQVITQRNKPMAVSPDYFRRSETFMPQDESGLVVKDRRTRHAAWQRANAFTDPN